MRRICRVLVEPSIFLMMTGIWVIPQQINQAETLLFLFKYIIDSHKKLSIPICDYFLKV